MKTTIELDDALIEAARRRASERGVPLHKIVEGALRAELHETPAHHGQPSQTDPEIGALVARVLARAESSAPSLTPKQEAAREETRYLIADNERRWKEYVEQHALPEESYVAANRRLKRLPTFEDDPDLSLKVEEVLAEHWRQK